MNKKGIHIIGAAKGIGKWFLEKVFIDYTKEYSIYCYDLDTSLSDLLKPYQDNKNITLPASVKNLIPESKSYQKFDENFNYGDWVIIAVPLQVLESTIIELNTVVKERSLYIAFNSTQVTPMDICKKIYLRTLAI